MSADLEVSARLSVKVAFWLTDLEDDGYGSRSCPEAIVAVLPRPRARSPPRPFPSVPAWATYCCSTAAWGTAAAQTARTRVSEVTLAALRTLSPEHRALVVLRYLLDWTPGEIAAALDLPRGTVNSRLRRALDALEPVLAEEER